MRLSQSQKQNSKNLFRRNFLVLFISIVSPLLSSCFLNSNEISTHMEMVIKKAYLDTFVLPTDPNARLEDIEYYQFLHRFRNKEGQTYLFAWEVYDDTDEWTLTINDNTFYFEHEVYFLVYQSNVKSFYSVEESIDEKLFTIADFAQSLNNLDVFISNGDSKD